MVLATAISAALGENQAMWKCAKAGRSDLMQHLVAAGAHVDQQDRGGNMLMAPSYEGNVEVV